MISRHFLRSKVLQIAYAAYVDPTDVVVAERNYKHHIARLNDLGTVQLSVVEHFVEVAATMMEEAKHKYIPTEEDKNPNYRMVNNLFLRRLVNNFDYKQHIKDANVNWGGVEYDEMFRQAYVAWSKMPIYKEYLATEQSFEKDHEYVLKLFKYLMNYSSLCEKIHEQSLFWEDDFDQIAQYNYKMLKAFTEDFDEATVIPLICDPRDESDMEAYEFARTLLLGTLRHRDEVENMIRKYLQGWEYERVAEMDILLLNMAFAELTECPSIPEKVTMDEYIELSKEFSSERSKLFINGILGKFIIELRSAGRINKTGRGLMTITPEEEEYAAGGTPEEEEIPVTVLPRKTRPRIKKSNTNNVND